MGYAFLTQVNPLDLRCARHPQDIPEESLSTFQEELWPGKHHKMNTLILITPSLILYLPRHQHA